MPTKPRRDTQWRAVLRPRRQRDLGGAGRERGPPRGPGAGPWLGRDGRRARVAPPVRPPPRQLDEGDPPARPAVADADADPARRDPQGRGDEDRHELLRGPARSAVRRPRPSVDGRRHRLPRPPRLDPGGPARGADPGRGRGRRAPGAARGTESRRDRAGRPARQLARGAGRGVRHGRFAGAAALHVRCDPVDAVRRGVAAPPGGSVAQHLRQPRLPVIPGRATVPALRRPGQRRRPAGAVRKGLSQVARGVLGTRSGLGCHRDGVQLEAGRAADGARGAPARVRGAEGAGRRAEDRERPPFDVPGGR